MKSSISVKCGPDTTVDGKKPIIVIGPNGSGKTRFGYSLSKWNQVDIIGALRSLKVASEIPMQTYDKATSDLKHYSLQHRNTPWALSSDIDSLLAKLLAENSDSAVQFRDEFLKNRQSPPNPSRTKLMVLREIWHSLFPGRQISFDRWKPVTSSTLQGQHQSYASRQMSDGERAALYLSARVLDASSKIIVVDEPEIHFHSRLAVQLWDSLERHRSDCRFIYITHDIPFALSRATPHFVVLRDGKPEIVDTSDQVPDDIVGSILSAASFSIFANTLLFCEGTEASLDRKFYRAYYKASSIAVIPVGTCKDVVRCTSTFASSSIVSNVAAAGIIDRDYWPDKYLENLPAEIHVSRYHEIESVFCDPEVFNAVCLYHGRSDASSLYSSFLEDMRRRITDKVAMKQVSERFCVRCKGEFEKALHAASVYDSEEETKQSHTSLFSSEEWLADLQKIFEEELAYIKQALEGDPQLVLARLPGKIYAGQLAKKVGMDFEAYANLILTALISEGVDGLAELGKNIRGSLNGKMPILT